MSPSFMKLDQGVQRPFLQLNIVKIYYESIIELDSNYESENSIHSNVRDNSICMNVKTMLIAEMKNSNLLEKCKPYATFKKMNEQSNYKM